MIIINASAIIITVDEGPFCLMRILYLNAYVLLLCNFECRASIYDYYQ